MSHAWLLNDVLRKGLYDRLGRQVLDIAGGSASLAIAEEISAEDRWRPPSSPWVFDTEGWPVATREFGSFLRAKARSALNA